MKNLLALIRSEPPIDPEPTPTLNLRPMEERPVATLAVPAAHAALGRRIADLDKSGDELELYITELNERLRQIRVTSKALSVAYHMLDDDIYENAAASSLQELQPTQE